MKTSVEKYQQQINQRSPQKILSKRNNNSQLQYLIKWKDHEEPTWEFEENIRNLIKNLSTNELEQLTNQNVKQTKQGGSQKYLQKSVQQGFKHPNCSEELLYNKQREITQKYCNAYPQSGDEINSVHLIITQEDCLFEIKWKSRSDGVQPISDFYQYDQFKVVAPMLFMDFLEICILGYEKNTEIQFKAPGKDNIERTQMIKRILLKNPKYVDTNQNQTEEVKSNEQTTQLKENNGAQKKNTIITFLQSEQKQKQAIQSQNKTQPQVQVDIQEQQQDEKLSQQNNLQSDQQLLEDNQTEQQQSEEKEQIVDQNQNQSYEEQIDQESISLEQQQE